MGHQKLLSLMMDKFMKKDKATADNRAYLATANASAQIPPNGWTSDTLGTLYEFAPMRRGL